MSVTDQTGNGLKDDDKDEVIDMTSKVGESKVSEKRCSSC